MKITKFGSHTFALTGVQDAHGTRGVAPTTMRTPYGDVNVVLDPVDHVSAGFRKRLELFASTPAALQTALDLLRAMRGEIDTLTLETYGGDERTIEARCTGVAYQRTARNFNHQEVLLSWDAPGGIMDGDAHDTSAGKTTGQTVVMTNDGNANVDDLIIEITAPGGGAITDIHIEESANVGIEVLYSGTVNAGQVLRLDAGEWLVENNDVADWANFSFEAAHLFAGIFRLVPGESTFTITFSGGGTATVRYIFNDKWK